MMGVNYDLFWTLNPKSLHPFIKAFELKTKYENTLQWQQGLYIQFAVGSILSKDINYPNSPFGDKVKRNTVEDNSMFKEKMLQRMNFINSRFEEGENE